MIEEIEFRNAKLTLDGVENDSMGAKALEYGSHILEVLLWIGLAIKNHRYRRTLKWFHGVLDL